MMGGGACSLLALRRICSEGELAVGELGAGAADTAMGGGDVGGGVLSGSGAGVRARPGRSRAEALWEKKGGRADMSTHTIRTCARVRAVADGEWRPLEDGKGLRQHQELEVGSGRDVVEQAADGVEIGITAVEERPLHQLDCSHGKSEKQAYEGDRSKFSMSDAKYHLVDGHAVGNVRKNDLIHAISVLQIGIRIFAHFQKLHVTIFCYRQ